MGRRVVIAFIIGILVAGCDARGADGPAPIEVVGVVTSVTGDLREIHEFEIQVDDGSTVQLIPAPRTTFDGGPLSHLFDHLRSGEPVRVTVVEGPLFRTAHAIGDAR